MVKAALIQTNFTGGEWSPRLDGRVGLDKYFDSVKSLKNMTVFPHGGATRRGGTQFIASVKESTQKSRLIPFEFSVTQAYVLEFGDSYIRFYKDKAQITSGTTTGAFAAAFAPAFDRVGTDIAIEVASPYLESELFQLQFAQSADQLFIAHPNHEPMVLSRTSDVSWTLSEITFVEGPVLPQNTTSTTLTPSATTGVGITITASAATGINNDLGFQDTDIGRMIRIDEGATFGYATITARGSTTQVTGTVTRDFTSITGQTTWQLGSWSDTTGFPGSVTFYEERLWWAGSINNPQTLWGSATDDFLNHLPGANDADPVQYAIATNQINSIQWLSAGKVLLIGTAGGEFLASGASLETAITPSNIRIVPQSGHGSENILPIRVANQVIFVQRHGRKLRQLIWDFDQEAWVAPDITLLAEHITETGIIEIDYQQEPDSIIWIVLTNGRLIGLTYELNQNVFAFHHHELGGQGDKAGNIAVVESVAVIPPSGSTPREEVWITVKRFINGVTRRYVECLVGGLESTDDQDQAFFVDSGLSLDNPITITGATQADPVVVTASAHGRSNGDVVKIDEVAGMTQLNKRKFTVANKTTNTVELSGEDGTEHDEYISGGKLRQAVTTISGLNHLEEETVAVLVDGAAHPDRQVVQGSITLQASAAVVHAGLSYLSEIETQRFEGGSQNGTSQGKQKRISDIRYRLDRTLGLLHGKDRENMDRINFRTTSDNMDEAPPLFTGDKDIEFPEGYTVEGKVILQQDQPLPLTVLAIMPIMKTNDK